MKSIDPYDKQRRFWAIKVEPGDGSHRRICPSALAVLVAALGGMIDAMLSSAAVAQQLPSPPSPPHIRAAPVPGLPVPVILSIPQPEVLLGLVRTTLIALDQANKTGNYAVLRALGGPALQAISEMQLSTMFAELRSRGIDLMPASVITPELSQSPVITQEGALRL